MARAILVDQFHVTVLAQRGLRAGEYDELRRTLDEPRFRAALRRAARKVFRRYPSLAKVRVLVSR
jgi:hypothetical protein